MGHVVNSGPGSVVGIATGYGLDGPEIESQWGARFSAPVQTGSGARPASCTMGTGSFPGVKCGRSVTLTLHPLLLPCQERVELYLYSPYEPTSCTEPQCLYKGDLDLYTLRCKYSRVVIDNNLLVNSGNMAEEKQSYLKLVLKT